MELAKLPSLEEQVKADLRKERAEAAKSKIKASLKCIQAAEQVLANATRAHAVLMKEIEDGDVS